MPHIDWRKLYEAAMLEMNPDKLATCIGAAERAIAQQESRPDITERAFMGVAAKVPSDTAFHVLPAIIWT